MRGKIISIWLSCVIIFSLIFVDNIILDQITTVSASSTLYVNTTGSGGAYMYIQDAIDNATDGDIVYVYNGTYQEIVTVDKSITLMGENENSTIIDQNGVFADVVTVTADWVNITGFTIMETVGGNSYAGIKLNNVGNCSIINVNTSGGGLGIYFIDSLNINIKKNIVTNTYFGIRIVSSSDINITDNIINQNYYGIHMDSSLRAVITKNTFINDGISLHGSQLPHFISHTIPINNIINGKPLYYHKNFNDTTIDAIPVGQLILVNCNNVDVRNLSINNTDLGIELAYSSNITITDNRISKGNHGILMYFSLDNNISYNTVTSNEWNGIYLYEDSDNNMIFFNNLSANKWTGAFIQGASNNISHNNILNNDYGGIIVGENSNEIYNNNISGNGKGIHLGWFAQESVIVNNNISSNLGNGIILDGPNNNKIINNTVSNNIDGLNLSFSDYNLIVKNKISLNSNFGLYLSEANDNEIHHNQIINNNKQAIDDRDSNYWDDGYPSGGNFWSDYIGVDNFKGPNQNISGSDSIGDTNYSIDSDSIDHYPLIGPNFPNENYTVLKQGWNLISIPLIQEEKDLTKVLGTIDSSYDSVQWYNSADTNDPWKHHKVGKPFQNDLSELNETIGFWIHITKPGDTTFLYNGTQPQRNQTISFLKGWNLAGYPSLTSYSRTKGLNNLTFGTHVGAIWTYNTTTQRWKEMGPSDYFEIGRGYWVHANVKCDWEVPL
jgi:parallel beta-helix repeat protein